jgi:L-amino acid N-acyltransferase YncA
MGIPGKPSSLMIRTHKAPPLTEDVREIWEKAHLSPPSEIPLGPWWVAYDASDRAVAVAGSEVFGTVALLRSVAVQEGLRSLGIGTQLVSFALETLLSQGVEDVYLVTETAAHFFSAWGFRSVSRETLPTAIAKTDQLLRACPVSAEVMHLHLGRAVVRIRTARATDAQAIARTRHPDMEDRTATLQTSLHTREDIGRWLFQRDPRSVVRVAETSSGVVGWLALQPLCTQQAYPFAAELSLYVEPWARGHGIGSRLLQDGIQQARKNGFHKLVLAIFPENTAARRLLEAHGFRSGVLHKEGQWDSVWYKTEMMERLLDDGSENRCGPSRAE